MGDIFGDAVIMRPEEIDYRVMEEECLRLRSPGHCIPCTIVATGELLKHLLIGTAGDPRIPGSGCNSMQCRKCGRWRR